MKRIIAFIKRHWLFSLFMVPVILEFITVIFGLPFLVLSVGPNIISESIAVMFSLTLLLLVLVYPFVLTVCNLYFIFKRHLTPFQKGLSKLTEAATIVAGFFLSWIYIMEMSNIVIANWPETLYNSQLHTPIATWTFPTVTALSVVGILGYLILRFIPLKKMSPLAVVLSMTSMYIGCLMCVLWIIQTSFPESGDVLLLLFPVNCILIAIKTVRGLLWQWKELHPVCEPDMEEVRTVKSRLKSLLYDSENWPLLALLFMLPLLGVLIAILTLFGQEPDSLIKAWTETSQWSLSQKTSPPNLDYDMHYLCTAAAGGHPGVVKPIRLGVRGGHTVVVNRQLCIANAFEQIVEERLPRLHRLIRRLYDTYGYPIARHIRTPFAADVTYLVMKPLEWLFLAVIYLNDVHPEDRIAMQYITPIGKESD